MKVFDLHTGEAMTLPSLMAPGRYRLLEAATLNATVALNVGDLLWSDGGTRCDLQDQKGVHWQSAFEPISADQADTWELVDQGVLTVAKLVENASDGLPAPLMPNSLTDFANPSAFEVELKRVLDAGHLHEISARPRMNMRYDSTVLPVSRARRLASGALERLASRSEDWHRRTLGGVEPARVLAEVSEDEWGIYENIVFARLVDQAIRLVSRRERALARLIERQSSALKLSQAKDLNYRLLEKLCQLWGQAWEVKPQSEDDPLHIRLQAVQKMAKRLRQLRFGVLYQAIPRTARVPIALKNTNVLTHDTHYREMAGLWQLAHQGERASSLKSDEKIRQRMAQHGYYAAFLGLLVRHALKASKILTPLAPPDAWQFAGTGLKLEQPHTCEWRLALAWPEKTRGSTKTLTFVAAWEGHSDWDAEAAGADAAAARQVVFCHPAQPTDEISPTGEDGVLNPLQFYAVERIKQRIESWLYRTALAAYPAVLPTLPTSLCEVLCQKAPQAFAPHHKGLSVVGPAHVDVRGLAGQHGANDTTRDQLQAGVALVCTLATCRVCGNPATTFKPDANGKTFWAACSSCGHEWGVRVQNQRLSLTFRFKTGPNHDEEANFRRYGACATV